MQISVRSIGRVTFCPLEPSRTALDLVSVSVALRVRSRPQGPGGQTSREGRALWNRLRVHGGASGHSLVTAAAC